MGATLKRGFCTPIVWSSEAFSLALIQRRVRAQAWRSRYRRWYPAPATLAEHLAQEVYVAEQLGELAASAQPLAHPVYTRLRALSDTPTLLAFLGR